MPKPCRKTYLVENILSSVSPSPSPTPSLVNADVFSPLREIGNTSRQRQRLPSTPTLPVTSKKKDYDVDEDGFKRPLPRKAPSLSAAQRQNIEDVKRYGLPSFTENFVLNTRRNRSGTTTNTKPPHSLTKSPSVSNLKDKFDKPYSNFSMKKTVSTSNLRRS